MKKSTIKRRKRVVPAYPQEPPTEGLSPHPAASTSPEPLSEREEQAEVSADGPATKRRRPPPSIDFTGYDLAPPVSSSKDKKEAKTDRSSESTDSMADYAAQAERAAAAAAAEPREGSHTNQQILERRAQLQREAEAMRIALRAKEKEIDDLQ